MAHFTQVSLVILAFTSLYTICRRCFLLLRTEVEYAGHDSVCFCIQNPPDCSETDQHVVQISTITCGFGCSLHSVVNGLLQAFVKNRTFVLVSENWRYAEEGWEYAFLPLTKCIRRLRSSGHNGRTDWRLSKLLQWSIPPELRPTLEKLHGQPYAWWIAQFTAYVFRLQPFLEKQLKQLAQEIGFTDSAVGIQIRWGDKLHNEANKHEVEEYMLYVEKWFKQLETREQSVERVIYLATEVKVAWGQLREKYPKYKFIRNLQSPERKGNKFRYRHEGLEDVITDIYFLSRCSYVVCTLSSSVCRTAYELMMNFHDDASTRFQSVDALYRVKGTKQQPWVAVMNHDPAWQDELEMKLGDKITVSLDPHLPFNDGYLRGENLRTGKEGRFPAYKVREELLSYHTFSFQKPWNPEKK